MHGVKRVIVFCILIVILPATLIIIPLYLRKTVFADVTYPVAESDIIEIRDGISSIFCQQHSLRMSTHFNAFQLRSRPEISANRKHIRLKKSMTLPDDTLEYWGFYLLKGAHVHLKFCSRYDGSRILVVKGQRDLKTCGLLDHNKNKVGANFAHGHEQVKVFFEDITEITEYIAAEDVDALNAKKVVEPKKGSNGDGYMELENHGGEDLSDNDLNISVAKSNTLATSITPTPEPTKQPRKKLKKGTPNSHKHKKTEETTLSNSLKASGNTEDSANRRRRHEYLEQQLLESKKERTLANDLNSTNIRNTSNHINKDLFGSQTSDKEKEVTLAGSNALDKASNLPLANHTRTSTEEEDEDFLRKHLSELERKRQQVFDQLYKQRPKREHVYDRKYSHGGNALNFTDTDESNSISSFENGLLDCYNGDILLAEGFPPSADCLNAHFLENGSHRMLSKHEVTEDGYYYYIFYSDNDLVRNDIHAIFDIYKPTFQYSNLSDSQGCVNATNCTFPIGFLSDEIVVVEVPTRDGIEHEEDDITYLISTCHPRMEIYAIFPITVLILILSCSFL